MCEFISWIEYKDEILYLTSKDLETRKGREMLKSVGREDIAGHGAIRYYFNIPDGKGTPKECTDFSTPNNFPEDIVRDIKEGLFIGFGIGKQLLTKPAWAEYKEIRQSEWAKYEKIRQSAFWGLVKQKKKRTGAWQ